MRRAHVSVHNGLPLSHPACTSPPDQSTLRSMQHTTDSTTARASRARAAVVPSATSAEVALLFGAIATFLLALLVLLL